MSLVPKYYKIPLILCGVIIIVGAIMLITDEVSPGILQIKGAGSKNIVMDGYGAISIGLFAMLLIFLAGMLDTKSKRK